MNKRFLIALIGLSGFIPAMMNLVQDQVIFDRHYLEARKSAFESGKALLIYFITDDCAKCEEQRRMIENDKELTETLEGKFETAIVNVDHFDGKAIQEIYNLGEIPGYLLVAPNGDILWQYQGHISKSDLMTVAGQEPVEQLPAGDASLAEKPDLAESRQKTNQVPSDGQKTNSHTTEKSAAGGSNLLPAFQIQFGYFGSQANAEKLENKLHELGQADCYIQEESRDGNIFYRVLSPLYPAQSDAAMILRMLKEKGLEGTIRQIQ